MFPEMQLEITWTIIKEEVSTFGRCKQFLHLSFRNDCNAITDEKEHSLCVNLMYGTSAVDFFRFGNKVL